MKKWCVAQWLCVLRYLDDLILPTTSSYYDEEVILHRDGLHNYKALHEECNFS